MRQNSRPICQKAIFKQIHSLILIVTFISSNLFTPYSHAQALPSTSSPISLTQPFTPAHLIGITIDPANALKFNFLVHEGDTALSATEKNAEYQKLVKYFLASLAVPDEAQWVNLSPYENNRIIDNLFGTTEMGRQMLEQDYLLKKLSAALMHPDSLSGKKFWDQIYAKTYSAYGTTDIPVDTFNKIWITPDKVSIYEKGATAVIVNSRLKVMTERDYLALKNQDPAIAREQEKNSIITREAVTNTILPLIEKEINEGKTFAALRQIVSGMELAAWYKKSLKESLLGKIYVDRGKLAGINQDPANNALIYQQYVQTFKTGIFNFIRDDYDRYSQETIPRKYFSGGINGVTTIEVTHNTDEAMKALSMIALTTEHVFNIVVMLHDANSTLLYWANRVNTESPSTRISLGHQLIHSAVLSHGLIRLYWKHPTTARHSLDVGKTGVELLMRMGFPIELSIALYTAGILHDRGKTEIPIEVLDKKSHFTKDDIQVMAQHSRLGQEKLAKSFILATFAYQSWLLAQYIAGHHHVTSLSKSPEDMELERKIRQIPELLVHIPVIAMIFHWVDIGRAMGSVRDYEKWTPPDYRYMLNDFNLDRLTPEAFLEAIKAQNQQHAKLEIIEEKQPIFTLNNILKMKALEQNYPGLDLPDEAKQILAKPDRTPDDQMILNRHILFAGHPNSPQPQKTVSEYEQSLLQNMFVLTHEAILFDLRRMIERTHQNEPEVLQQMLTAIDIYDEMFGSQKFTLTQFRRENKDPIALAIAVARQYDLDHPDFLDEETAIAWLNATISSNGITLPEIDFSKKHATDPIDVRQTVSNMAQVKLAQLRGLPTEQPLLTARRWEISRQFKALAPQTFEKDSPQIAAIENFDDAQTAKGGIDLNSAGLDMEIRRDGNGVPLPVGQQDLDHISINGLIPEILSIKPARGLPI